jgi:N-hydroxyarylamine O-acetyltransferase
MIDDVFFQQKRGLSMHFYYDLRPIVYFLRKKKIFQILVVTCFILFTCGSASAFVSKVASPRHQLTLRNKEESVGAPPKENDDTTLSTPLLTNNLKEPVISQTDTLKSHVILSAGMENLSTRYFKRLGLDRDKLNSLSSLQRLETICEAHVKTIPFENLSQHGVGEPVSLDTTMIADKLFDRLRGGFCFELNGMLAELLLELGYNVVRVPAHVYTGDGYMEVASHMFLMVTLYNDLNKEESTRYLVDVGFGEPSIHPLRYDFDSVQVTPEGMTSRIVTNGDSSVLEWLEVKTGAFVPRFKFKHTDALIDGKGPALVDFQDNLMSVYHPNSSFERKIIVCCIDRLVKRTVAGNRVKITGPPRFDKRTIPVVQEIGDEDAVRAVLDSDFGIPLEETEGLTLSKSLQSPSNLWM